MRFSKIRLWAAGLVAFLFGFPLTEKVLAASSWDVIGSSIDLGMSIADSAGDS
jgi:hypothetical protein